MSAQPTRTIVVTSRLLAIALAATALAAVSAGTGRSARHAADRLGVTDARPLPKALVGSWTRRITPADDKRFGVQGSDYRCLNSMTITGDGGLILRSSGCRIPGNNGVISGTITSTAASVVRIDFGVLPTAPVVAWSVSGSVLKTKVLRALTNTDRELWTGIWKRKK